MSLSKKLAIIKQYISLKKDTLVGDIVIVGTPANIFYAVVRDICPDTKKDWFSVRFTALVFPPVDLTWKLRYPQMCGAFFTINGEEHCMAAVVLRSEPEDKCTDDHRRSSAPDPSGKVIQFLRRSKR